MNLRGARHRDEPEINFIPLIDVLLVILIFLMVTTTYQRVAELKITLPEANADPMQQRPKEINVGVSAQGQYMVDKSLMQFTTVSALADALSRAAAGAKDPVIIINADANATHQSVIHVMEAARQAGFDAEPIQQTGVAVTLRIFGGQQHIANEDRVRACQETQQLRLARQRQAPR